MDYKVPFMFGKVEEIGVDGSDTIIRFSVEGVIDNMTKYPVAYPIGNHTHKISKGDSVFITRVSELNRFFYQHLDFSNFLGLKYDNNNLVEVKNEKVYLKSNGSVEISVINVLNEETANLKIDSNGNVFLKHSGKLFGPFCPSHCFMTDAQHAFDDDLGTTPTGT